MNTRTLLVIPYQLTRAPLSLVDTRLVQRLPQDSAPRLAFDRAFGSFDRFAGRLLANDDIVQKGVDRSTRSDKLAAAVLLERDAESRREEADLAVESAEEKAEQKRNAAQQRVVDGLNAAEATEEQGKRAATANARQQAARDKQAAQERADQRTAAIRGGVAQADAVANAKQNAAQRTAKAKFDDVTQTKAEARQAREDADKLSQLADAKKAERTK